MFKRKEATNRTERTLRFMRCFEECIEALAKSKQLPLPICYQRSKIYYKLDNAINQEPNVYLFEYPVEDINVYFNYLNNFEYLNSNNVLDKNTIEYLVSNSCVRVNNIGKWILITKIKVSIFLNLK